MLRAPVAVDVNGCDTFGHRDDSYDIFLLKTACSVCSSIC